MQEYITLMIKCLVVYFVIIIALRIMGKREVGELSVFDIVIYLVMSELLAISITESHESILKSLVPIFTLAVLQIIISWILLKSKKVRDIFDGKSVILIHNGHINQDAMRKNRYNIDDLMSQIRSHDLCTPDEVAFAVLENNGYPTPTHVAMQLEQEDLSGDVLLITMEEKQKSQIWETYENAPHVYTLKEYVGETGDIPALYGQPLSVYAQCYTEMELLMRRLVIRLNEEEEL